MKMKLGQPIPKGKRGSIKGKAPMPAMPMPSSLPSPAPIAPAIGTPSPSGMDPMKAQMLARMLAGEG